MQTISNITSDDIFCSSLMDSSRWSTVVDQQNPMMDVVSLYSSLSRSLSYCFLILKIQV